MAHHSSKQPRALISGIDGFTGVYLEKEFRNAGYDVFGITDIAQTHTPNRIVCNLLDYSALCKAVADTKPDVVAHLAAVSFVAHNDVDALYRVNITGTRNLLSALAECGIPVKSVLLASSANIYGNATTGIIDEKCPLAPANDYSVSKVAMEYMARIWMDRLPITIVRPFNYTGTGQAPNFLVPKIVRHFREHAESIELGNLDVIRDFSDVRSVAVIYRKLLERAPAGEVFNVCSGVGTALVDVIAMMNAIAGYQIKVQVNPAFVRSNEVKKLIGSSEKLGGVLGDLPSFPFEETLRWMFSSPDNT